MAIKKRFKAKHLLLLSIIALSLFFLMNFTSALIIPINSGNAYFNVTNESTFTHSHLNTSNPNIEALYLLDQNTSNSINDYSNNLNNGNILNGTLFTNNALIGGARQFNGINQTINVPFSNSLNSSGDFTISFWLNQSSSANNEQIISMWDDTANTGWHIFRFSATDYRFEWKGTDNAIHHLDVASANTTGWHQVVATVTAGSQLLYFDGVQVDSSTNARFIIANSNPLIIGGAGNTTNPTFNGTLDSISLYNKVLNATEVTQTFNQTISRFYTTGQIDFRGVNLGAFMDNLNVSISTCMNFLNTSLAIKINNGTSKNLTNCVFNNYSLSGFDTTNLNVSLLFISPNGFYTPLAIGNLTLTASFVNDTINPNGTIISPSNQTYTNNTALNFTVNATDDRNLSQAQLFILNSTGGIINQTNISITGTSATASTVVGGLLEGIYTFFFKIVDSAGNVFTTIVNTFTIDLTKPFIQIFNPLPNTYYNHQIVSLNFSTQDNSMSACWFVNSTGTTFINCFQNFTTFSSEGNNTWTLWANDTAGNTNFKQVNFTQDTIFPTIQYTIPTHANNSIVSQNFIPIAIIANDTNFDRMTFYLKNSSTVLHQDTFTFINNLVTYTSVPDGVYQYSVNITDLAGNLNKTPEFTITLDTIKPSMNITYPLSANVSGNHSALNYTIVDANPNLCWYSTDNGLINSSTVNSGINFTNVPSFDGFNTWTLYCNDTAGNLNSTSVSFTQDSTLPQITIIHPLGVAEALNETVIFAVNVSDLVGIDTTLANITAPDNSSTVIIMDGQQGSDNFQNNSQWFVENNTVGDNQTCFANISNGKMTTNIAGDGSPIVDNLCSLITKNALFGDFDMNVSFNITKEQGLDDAINLNLLSQFQTSSGASEYLFIGRTNFEGQGKQYQIFTSDSNHQGYINLIDTNDTFGKMRIKRIGNNFTFYLWDNIGNNWINAGNDTLDLHGGMWVGIESESTANGYGNISADWTNFSIINGNDYKIGQYLASINGTYFINFTVNDTFGNTNSNLTTFSVGGENNAPSVPFILTPFQNQITSGIFKIQWVNSVDANHDPISYTIQLLNSDGTFNQTIVSNYGSTTTNSYNWNTATVQDDSYKIKIIATETLTSEHLNSSDTSFIFSVSNQPPFISFVSPSELNNSIYGRTDINVNATTLPLEIKNITINLYNTTSLISSINSNSTPFYVHFVNLSNGIYFFNATSCSIIGNCGFSETRKVTINQGLFGQINLTLFAVNYPYVDVNTSYPVSFSFMSNGGSVVDGVLNLTINNPDGSNQSFVLPYNATSQLYLINLLFSAVGDYPFTINATSISFGSIVEHGTFLVRTPYFVTIQLYHPDGTPLIDNYGFITVEYIGNQKINPYLENYLHPVATINWVQPAFHSPYINGNATIKLYEPQKDYVFRYLNGQVKFDSYYSKPNVTKSLGENVYLGTQNLNGTSVTEQFVLTTTDLHQYFALFNWITLILLGFIGIISLALFLVVPDKPQIALVFGLLFAGVTILIRVGVFLFLGK